MTEPAPFSEFSCRRCGDCCRKHGLYPATSSDVVALAGGLGITVDAALEEYCAVATHDGRLGLFLRGLAGECPFLKDDGCLVHDFKPEVCRIYPDNDGFVTGWRLKAGIKGSTVRGEGLSRCAAWDLADESILPPNLENTVRFRIKEDTDRHYFASHEEIDSTMVEYLAKLAEFRLGDLPLYLATGRKYGLLRQLHTAGLPDVNSFVQAERDIMYRYLATYAELHGLEEEVVRCSGTRATYVDGRPGIMLLCDRLPSSAEEGHFLFKQYGDTGIFAAMIESGLTAYVTTFTIDTPCLGEIVRDGELGLKLKTVNGSLDVRCSKGVP